MLGDDILHEDGEVEEDTTSCYNRSLPERSLDALGLYYEQEGKTELAIKFYEDSIHANNDFVSALHNLGRLICETINEDMAEDEKGSRLKAAESYLFRACKISDDKSIQNTLLLYYQLAADWDNALKTANSLTIYLKYEANLDFSNNISMCYFEYANSLYKKASYLMSLGPEYNNESLRWFDEALTYYNKSLRYMFDNYNALSQKGCTLQKLNNLKESCNCFRKVVKNNPKSDYIDWYNYAESLFLLNHLNLASYVIKVAGNLNYADINLNNASSDSIDPDIIELSSKIYGLLNSKEYTSNKVITNSYRSRYKPLTPIIENGNLNNSFESTKLTNI